MVHKIDRLAKNLEDHVAIKAILKRKDVALLSVVENIEDSASGRLIEGIHALMAEFYSSNLAMEVKKGIDQKVKLGGWPTKAPLGYKNVKIKVEGRHEPIADKELFERVQEVLKARNQAGERKRKHPRYLKGTIYCGECGSRMSTTIAKGEYTYFYCLSQKRHNGCK